MSDASALQDGSVAPAAVESSVAEPTVAEISMPLSEAAHDGSKSPGSEGPPESALPPLDSEAAMFVELLHTFCQEAKLEQLVQSEANLEMLQEVLVKTNQLTVSDVKGAVHDAVQKVETSEAKAKLEVMLEDTDLKIPEVSMLVHEAKKRSQSGDTAQWKDKVTASLSNSEVDVWVRHLSCLGHVLVESDNPYAGRDIIRSCRALHDHPFSGLLWKQGWKNMERVQNAAKKSDDVKEELAEAQGVWSGFYGDTRNAAVIDRMTLLVNTLRGDLGRAEKVLVKKFALRDIWRASVAVGLGRSVKREAKFNALVVEEKMKLAAAGLPMAQVTSEEIYVLAAESRIEPTDTAWRAFIKLQLVHIGEDTTEAEEADEDEPGAEVDEEMRDLMVQLLASMQELSALFLLPPALLNAASASDDLPPIEGSYEVGGYMAGEYTLDYKLYGIVVSHMALAFDGFAMKWLPDGFRPDSSSAEGGTGTSTGTSAGIGSEEEQGAANQPSLNPSAGAEAAKAGADVVGWPAMEFTIQKVAIEMEEIRWSIKQTNFPYFYGEGTATVAFSNISVTYGLAFDVNPLSPTAGPHLVPSGVELNGMTISFGSNMSGWLASAFNGLFQEQVKLMIGDQVKDHVDTQVDAACVILRTVLQRRLSKAGVVSNSGANSPAKKEIAGNEGGEGAQ